ncbi:MAG: AAA family ATPase [Dehalococcoidia bacterium]|nr:AAA family ATPase [Dehalococcoidia bacterium]
MLHLKHLEVEGFRGFPKKSDPFEFTAPAVLLHGGNHQGKSSILNAIEWCLYGDQCVGQKSGIRERVGGWVIVNRNVPKASVKLVIDTDKGVTTINRAEVKGKGRGERTIEVELPDGSVKKGVDAEKEITRLAGLSFKDFATTVYQHQETIHAILVQTPSERSDAIDRLLGLSDYRNVLDGIKRSKIADVQKELAEQFYSFQALVEQTVKIRQDELEHKKEKAVDSGLDANQLNEHKLLEVASDVRNQIGKFASEMAITAAPISSPANWKGAQTFTAEATNEIERLWSESADVKEQSQLNSKRTKADTIKTNCEQQKQAVATAEVEVQKFEQSHGNQEMIETEIRATQSTIAAVDDEIRQVSPKAKLVQEGIALLEATAPAYGTDVCPLCGKTAPNLLNHLKKEWTEKIEWQVHDLNTRWSKLAERKVELEGLKAKHELLTVDAAEAKEQLKASVDKAAEFLGKELTDRDDPIAMLGKEIGEIDDRIIKIEDAIKDKRETLDKISKSLNRLNLLYEVLEFEERISGIQKIEDTTEYKEQNEIRDKVAALVADVEKVDSTVRECMSEQAKNKMKAAAGAIDDYFQKIVGNPAIQELSVEIEEDTRTGGNSYTFRDQNGEELNPVLSQGDLNALALSMFLGLVKAYSHPIGFIMMDDPSQSLGTTQKKRLVEVMDEVCEDRNLIVSTMDSELQEFLQSGLTKAKTIYEFSNWDPKTGPNVIKVV